MKNNYLMISRQDDEEKCICNESKAKDEDLETVNFNWTFLENNYCGTEASAEVWLMLKIHMLESLSTIALISALRRLESFQLFLQLLH